MSKMTKTQVSHLEKRLKKALNDKANEKFPLISNTGPNNQEVRAKSKEIAKTLKIDLQTYHFSLDNLSRVILNTGKGSVAERNLKIQKDRGEYRKVKQSKIDSILDEAILGDSTEALEALKNFQKEL